MYVRSIVYTPGARKPNLAAVKLKAPPAGLAARIGAPLPTAVVPGRTRDTCHAQPTLNATAAATAIAIDGHRRAIINRLAAGHTYLLSIAMYPR